MFVEPQPTRYDVTFRALGFPARVSPWFWLVAVLLGRGVLAAADGPTLLVLWVGVVFASILVHELGHALAFRWYGAADARVWLYAFGGLAVAADARLTPWRGIAVALAGPAAGFGLFALVWASDAAAGWSGNNRLAGFVYDQLCFVNLAWGLVNLLPVWPLDGGRVCRHAYELAAADRPVAASLRVSVGAAAAAVVYSLACQMSPPPGAIAGLPWWVPRGDLYTAMMFGLLGYSSWELLQRAGRAGVWDDPDDDTPPWRR